MLDLFSAPLSIHKSRFFLTTSRLLFTSSFSIFLLFADDLVYMIWQTSSCNLASSSPFLISVGTSNSVSHYNQICNRDNYDYSYTLPLK